MGINFPRKLFHLAFSLFLYFLYKNLNFKTFQITLVIFLIFSFTWEILRLKKPSLLPLKNLWERLLKAKEKDKPTDALYYLLGLIGATFVSPPQNLGLLILVLGISDPFAEISGKVLRSKKLFKEKTLSGSLTFFLTSLLLTFLYFKEISLHSAVLFSLVLTLTELLTERDNFWVPLSGALFARFFLSVNSIHF